MSPASRVLFATLMLVTITAGGAVGYVTIEGWSWVDAIYMSVITLSTVGFGEVRALTPMGRMFTTGFIIVGVATAFYLFTGVAEVIVEGRLRALLKRRIRERRIGRMEDHIIVAGYGRFGRAVAEELDVRKVVVIEQDPDIEPELVERDLAYVIGSAASDEVLRHAGIETAEAIVVATGSEAENVFITLAARELGPALRIHARADTDSGIRRLQRAGADYVTSPFRMAGMRTAASILRPAVVDFVELSAPRRGEPVDLEEVRIEAGSALAGRPLASLVREGSRHRVVALKRGDQPMILAPSGDEVVHPGDHLVVIGPREDLNQLARDAQAEEG